MRRRHWPLAVCALAVTLTCPGAAGADFAWEVQITDGVILSDLKAQPSRRIERGYIADNLVKITENDGREWWLYNLDTRTAWRVGVDDPARGTGAFFEVSFEDLQALLARSDRERLAALARREAQARDAPSIRLQRDLALINAQRLFLTYGVQPITHTRRDETRTIQGYTCRAVDAYEGDRFFQRLWVTGDITPPPEYEHFIRVLSEIDPRHYATRRGLHGFPVLSEVNLDGVVNRRELISISTDPIPVAAFLLPERARLLTTQVADEAN